MKIDIKSISALDPKKVYAFELGEGHTVEDLRNRFIGLYKRTGILIVTYERGFGKFINPEGIPKEEPIISEQHNGSPENLGELPKMLKWCGDDPKRMKKFIKAFPTKNKLRDLPPGKKRKKVSS